MVPSAVRDKFSTKENTPSRPARQRGNMRVPQGRTLSVHRTFRYVGVHIWNEILSVDHQCSMCTYKLKAINTYRKIRNTNQYILEALKMVYTWDIHYQVCQGVAWRFNKIYSAIQGCYFFPSQSICLPIYTGVSGGELKLLSEKEMNVDLLNKQSISNIRSNVVKYSFYVSALIAMCYYGKVWKPVLYKSCTLMAIKISIYVFIFSLLFFAFHH